MPSSPFWMLLNDSCQMRQYTAVDSESDKTVVLDTNCTGVLFKSIKTFVNPCILIMFLGAKIAYFTEIHEHCQ